MMQPSQISVLAKHLRCNHYISLAEGDDASMPDGEPEWFTIAVEPQPLVRRGGYAELNGAAYHIPCIGGDWLIKSIGGN
jgi:hypothetical protein